MKVDATNLKKYAISIMDFYNNDMVVEIHEASNLLLAILQHSSLEDDFYDWVASDCPKDEEGIKDFFFDGDIAIGWCEV